MNASIPNPRHTHKMHFPERLRIVNIKLSGTHLAIQHAYAELTLGRKPCKSMPPASEWRARPALLAPSRFTGIFKCDKALAPDPHTE